MIALAVEHLVPAELFGPVGAVGDVGNGALGPNMSAYPVGIIALVGDHDGARFEPVEQGLGAEDVMDLSGRDQEAERAAFRVDAGVDLGGEAASASAHTTISTLFFTPEAC